MNNLKLLTFVRNVANRRPINYVEISASHDNAFGPNQKQDRIYFSSTTFNHLMKETEIWSPSALHGAKKCETMLKSLATDSWNHNVIDSKSLPFLPLSCALFKKDKHFADSNVALNWWSRMEPNLKSLSTRDLINSLNGLSQINCATDDEIVKILGWGKIIDLIEVALQPSSKPAIRHLYEALKSLILMNYQNTTSENEKVLLKNILTNALIYSIDKINENPRNYFLYDLKYNNSAFARTLNKSTQIIEKLSDDYLSKIVNFYSKNITDSCARPSADFSVNYLVDIDALAQSFLAWDVNPNDYDEKFWSKWYSEMPKHFPFVRRRLQDRAVFLRTYIQVALKYNQESEFVKIKFKIVDNLNLAKEFLNIGDAKYLSDEINIKYAGKTDKFIESGLRPVLNVLETICDSDPDKKYF